MIEMDISTCLFIYLFVSVVTVFAAWLFLDFGTKLGTFSSEERYIWHCSICSHTYIDSQHEDISRCPKCGSYLEQANRGVGTGIEGYGKKATGGRL